MKLEKFIIDKLSDSLAGMFVNLIVETSKTWRFYFDENDRASMRLKAKNFITGILKNGR